MGPSIWQLIIVLVIIVLIFGTKKLRNMGSDLGGAMKSFKSAINEKEDKESSDNSTDKVEGRIIEGSTEDEVEQKSSSEEKQNS